MPAPDYDVGFGHPGHWSLRSTGFYLNIPADIPASFFFITGVMDDSVIIFPRVNSMEIWFLYQTPGTVYT